MSASTKPNAKPRPRKPVYFCVRRVIDAETGEQIGALVPLTKWDARAMRDRKMHVNVELRAELKQRRNVKFHRLSHALGALMADQHEAFAGIGAHDALKRLQAESGAACETVQYDLPGGLGKLTRQEPRSLAFDELDEGEFQEVMRTIVAHIRAKYWPDMTEEAIAEMVEMYDREH